LWYFDPGTYAIQWGGDRSKCIDAGQSMTAGTQLMLWSCNGQKQQKWGYDSNLGTVYLAESLANANLCMDLAGQSTNYGTSVQVWGCSGLWNQKWSLSRGITIRVMEDFTYCLDLAGSKDDNGTPTQLWKCNGKANQKWIWDDGTIKSAQNGNKCIDAGNYDQHEGLQLWDCNGAWQQQWGFDSNANTIYLSRSLSNTTRDDPRSNGLPGNTWVEILHSAFKMDGSSTWFYYAPGTGIWMYTGTTKVYNNHADAARDLLHRPCSDLTNECIAEFESMYKAARSRGLYCFQFLKHADMQCGSGEHNLAIEIVDVKGPGTTTCSQRMSGPTRFRAGWEAKHACTCDNSKSTINCHGFGLSR